MKNTEGDAATFIGDSTYSHVRAEIDLSDGMVQRYEVGSGRNAAKRITYQAGRVKVGDDVELPAVQIQATINDEGFLRMVKIAHIVRANINLPLTEADFAVAAPAEALMLDHRGESARPTFFRTESAEPDVVAFVDRKLAEREEVQPLR